jgi:hypothetical protein
MGAVSDMNRMTAKYPETGRVERRDPEIPYLGSKNFFESRLHLPRSFIGERNREQVGGMNTVFFDEMGDAMDDDTRLSASGTRNDEKRTFTVRHGFELLRI